jgi:hypothetical protein
MDIEALLSSFRQRGIELTPDGPNSLIATPASKLTDTDRVAICSHGPELFAYLRAREVARWCEEHRIDAKIGTAILEIERQALALGWRFERLWNHCFWPHSAEDSRGLASALTPAMSWARSPATSSSSAKLTAINNNS